MEISQLKIWKNYPYQDGGYVVWKPGAALPSPDVSLADAVHCPRPRLYDAFRVPIEWAQIYDAAYLTFRATLSGGATVDYCGWVDDVQLISDDPTTPVSQIAWHEDLWRGWIERAVVKDGIVVRRPVPEDEIDSNIGIPPQPYPHRWVGPDDWNGAPSGAGRVVSFLPDNDWWIYIVMDRVMGERPVPEGAPEGTEPIPIRAITMACVPYGHHKHLGTSDLLPDEAMRTGQWDEELCIPPSSIKGVYALPMGPSHVEGTTMRGWVDWKPQGSSYGVMVPSRDLDNRHILNLSAALPTPNDVTRVYLTGYNGEVVGSLPWGCDYYAGDQRIIGASVMISEAGPYIMLNSAYGNTSDAAIGLAWNIPPIRLGTSGNSASEYVFSGAMAADEKAQKLAADQARMQGHLGATTSAVSGGVGGALAAGGIGGAIAGAVLAPLLNAAGTEFSYWRTTKEGGYNDRQIEINQHVAASQPNPAILAMGDWLFTQRAVPCFRVYEIDSYSKQRRHDDIATYGAHVREPTEDCNPLIEAGGGLQILNAQVTGPVPAAARAYIKQRLADGVVIR